MEDNQRSRNEHAKFLLFQMKEILEGQPGRQDDTCVLQCGDGSLPLPSLLLAGLSPLLGKLLASTDATMDQAVIILPELEMGEVMLFLKYLLSVNVDNFFAYEDTPTIRKVGRYFEADFEVSQAIRKDIKLSKLAIKDPFQGAKQAKSVRRTEIRADEELVAEEMACPFCQTPVNVVVVWKHLKQVHPELEHACLQCHQTFTSRSELEEHIQIHPDSKWFRACQVCPRVSLTQYAYQQHRSTHQTGTSLKCRHCDRVFVKEVNLRKHEEQHELGKLGRTHACLQCPKTFSKPSNLTRHLKSHFGIKAFACDQCNAHFVDSTRLKEHKWIHLDYAKFKCPLNDCTATFRHRSNLRNHMTKVHDDKDCPGKKLTCTLCARQFAFEYKLRNHMRLHQMAEATLKKELTEETVTEFKDSSVYVCASCKREFKTIDDLGTHCKEFHKQVAEPAAKKRKVDQHSNPDDPDPLPPAQINLLSSETVTPPVNQPSRPLLPVLDHQPTLHTVVQPLPRNMPTLTLELDASKGLHLDAETKRHLKTLEDIRLESNDSGSPESAAAAAAVTAATAAAPIRLEFLNDISPAVLSHNIRLNDDGQIVMEVNPDMPGSLSQH